MPASSLGNVTDLQRRQGISLDATRCKRQVGKQDSGAAAWGKLNGPKWFARQPYGFPTIQFAEMGNIPF